MGYGSFWLHGWHHGMAFVSNKKRQSSQSGLATCFFFAVIGLGQWNSFQWSGWQLCWFWLHRALKSRSTCCPHPMTVLPGIKGSWVLLATAVLFEGSSQRLKICSVSQWPHLLNFLKSTMVPFPIDVATTTQGYYLQLAHDLKSLTSFWKHLKAPSWSHPFSGGRKLWMPAIIFTKVL